MADPEHMFADTPEGLLKILGKGKRSHHVTPENSAHTQPAKKAKLSSTTSSLAASYIRTDSTAIPNPPHPLASSYDITSMSINSSTKMGKKVTQVLQILSDYPAIPPRKPKVVQLHSKASAASKMITIAEIAKREIVTGGGKWFQYNTVEEVMVEQKETQKKGQDKDKRRNTQKKVVDEEDEDANEDERVGDVSEEDAFETMKTPFERSIEGKPKVRGIPVMTLYLSRIKIDSLRKEYG
jgi:hypothetical protein